MENDIKVLTSFIGKPVKDWRTEDIDKIVASQEYRNKLLDIDVVENLLGLTESNKEIQDVLNPIYITLAYREHSDWVDSNFRKRMSLIPTVEKEMITESIDDNGNKKEEKRMVSVPVEMTQEQKEELEKFDNWFKESLQAYMESDDILAVLYSSLVLLLVYKDFELNHYEETIKESLRQLEALVCSLDVPTMWELLKNLVNNLYFPVINAYKEKYNVDLITDYNEEFKNKLKEYEYFLREIFYLEEEPGDNNAKQ